LLSAFPIERFMTNIRAAAINTYWKQSCFAQNASIPQPLPDGFVRVLLLSITVMLEHRLIPLRDLQSK